MSSNQARGRRSPPVHKTQRVIRRTDGHSSSVRLPSLAPYPSAGRSSADRVVRPYEPPALLTCLRLTRAFSLSTSRACHKVHVEDGTHRVDIRPTSGSLTLHGDPLPTTNTNETDQLEDDDTVYEIDRILKAEKIGNRYRLLVKWKGNYDPSPMWRSDLVNQTTNEDLLEEIEDAVQRCREELREANEIDDDPVVADKEEEVHVAEGGETDGRRARKRTSRYEPTWFLPELPAERIALLKLRTFHVP